MPDLNYFRYTSGKYGLPLQFVMKEFHVMDVLKQIVLINSKLKLKIIFKGGTAINKVYFGGLSRFSEDLDFDEISGIKFKERVEKIKELVNNIKGYEIEGPRFLHFTVRFELYYKNELGQKDHVRLEFNLKSKKIISINKINFGVVKSDIAGTTISSVSVYSLEDLIARKIHALYDRMEGKDIYDINTGLEKADKRKVAKAIRKLMEIKRHKNGEFIIKLIEKIKKINVKKIKGLTNNYIPISLRPKDWNELINSLILRLESIK